MAAHARLICPSAELLDGGRGVRFTIERQGVVEPAFVIRFDGRVRAYVNRCGHVPVELDWQHNEFFDDSKIYLICATHGALYSPADGRCLGGRCNGRGLTPVDVEERDDAVYLTASENEP